MKLQVRLRDVIESDLPIFFEHQREPQANQMAGFPARAEDVFFSHWKTKVLTKEKNFKKTIVFNGAVAGNILCWEQEGKWLVGYWIGQQYWGKGVATLALTELLRILPRRPLYAYVSVNNPGSVRVLEKCGFAIDSSDAEEILMVCS